MNRPMAGSIICLLITPIVCGSGVNERCNLTLLTELAPPHGMSCKIRDEQDQESFLIDRIAIKLSISCLADYGESPIFWTKFSKLAWDKFYMMVLILLSFCPWELNKSLGKA